MPRGAPHLPAILVVATLAACSSDYGPTPGPSPSPTATPTPGVAGVTTGSATGPTRIVLLAVDPPSGAEIAGCGSSIADCSGRLRMVFRVEPTRTGDVLFYRAFLHAENQTGCLFGQELGGSLNAGTPVTVEVVFDEAGSSDRCRPPLVLRNLAFAVEGTVEVASRQEWSLVYRLSP